MDTIKYKHVLLTLGLLIYGVLNQAFASQAPFIDDNKVLVEKLRQGGHVIFFRHGITEKSGEKHIPTSKINDCSIQRNLSKQGVRQIKQVGKIIKQLKIPVGKVYTSPYCRCRDTAKYLFGDATISNSLFYAIHLKRSQREEITRQLQQMLATPPAEGTNNVLVSHSANLKEATNIWTKTEGEAHIFKPLSNGSFTYSGSIMPRQWIELVNQ